MGLLEEEKKLEREGGLKRLEFLFLKKLVLDFVQCIKRVEYRRKRKKRSLYLTQINPSV
jgi:hypothetical protein